jgi:hypothetical protein
MIESEVIAVKPAADAPVEVAPPKEVIPLPEILRQIARDAQVDAAQFLEETKVPYGGE